MNMDLGRKGEDEALKYLLAKDYVLVSRNYRNKLGEIDLVMRKGGVVIGVEVKAKRTGGISASEMLTPKKIEKVKRVLGSLAWQCQELRVEAVTMEFGEDDEVILIEHFDEIS